MNTSPHLSVPQAVQDTLYTGVAELFGVNLTQLGADQRSNRTTTQARRAIVLALRYWDPSITLEQLALAIFRNDHTTAIYALEKGAADLAADPTFRARAEQLMARVGKRSEAASLPDGMDPAFYQEQAEIWRQRYLNTQKVLASLQTQLDGLQRSMSFLAPQLVEAGQKPALN